MSDISQKGKSVKVAVCICLKSIIKEKYKICLLSINIEKWVGCDMYMSDVNQQVKGV